ncbi:hypothetical protein L917_00397 [Phytophthora nicotianae]|uniref:Myb-like domain-containing protein n=1 Tax=Phytophthora nicotianae TaxID=4792 RepID=W2JXD9_PHYNI|nr:hypothetical protein L915_00422 [Phytophthora nicotianae]ETL50318.1 hypothetical protein L916_00425 [Phytophthora nicotianae]ETM03379.1 hypothetical protein L917_00397 [Phytophthora nicotianae]
MTPSFLTTGLPLSFYFGGSIAMPNATQWTNEEDERLFQAYTNISEDGATVWF